MGILCITSVTQCNHCKVRHVEWVDKGDKLTAPWLRFLGMPENGSIILAKNEVIVLCGLCTSTKAVADKIDVEAMRIACAIRRQESGH